MWFVFILLGIISGLMFSNVEEVNKNGTGPIVIQLKGCPTEIPLIENGTNKIVAARVYPFGSSDALAALSCRGDYIDYYAETEHRATSNDYRVPGYILFSSAIINPGCTAYVFSKKNHTLKEFTGPEVLTRVRYHHEKGYFGVLQGRLTSIESRGDSTTILDRILFTCKQVVPSCIPRDRFQVVTTLDNSGSGVSTKFTYTETIGTTFSHSMSESRSVSDTVKAEITATFFGSFSATLGVSRETGYDWTHADSETKSKSDTYEVEVTIPGRAKVYIEEAVGYCGGSTVHTQMFRVKDGHTNQILKVQLGKMTKYKLSKRDFKKKN